jgi:hypothetical protein
MNTLFKLSEKVGLMSTAIGAIVWLACGTYATLAVINALWQFPRIAFVIAMAFIVVTGIGGLVGYWLVADRIDFWRLGYQVKWIRANDWVYEERSVASEERILPYIREVRGQGYPAPCAIRILSQEDWESEAPFWAQGRRNEIVGRIANCHGANNGGEILIGKKALREAKVITPRESADERRAPGEHGH